MGQMASLVTNRNRNVRREAANEEDPEQQLAFSNTTGSYFGSHFLMCDCKFEQAKPEAYLFGENSDLDQLGNKALNFPYPLGPIGNVVIRPLNLLINIRKESVKFTRVKKEDGTFDNNLYQLNCVFDADCSCILQVHFHARELNNDDNTPFAYRNKRKIVSDEYQFETGPDQVFNTFIFDASQWDLTELSYSAGLYFPMVISITTHGIEKPQMQTTLCTIEIANDSSKSVVLKPLRQKIVCDGVIYLLQEIFGIENKETHGLDDDGSLECIICMSDIRDTVILPCRHLCICSNCADTLRYKVNNCPICRSPFRALIRLRAHRQTRNQIYETVSLVEGLNGSNGTSTSGDTLSVRGSTRRLRSSGRNRGPLHQVLTMEQLTNTKPVGSECIEMTYIANEAEEVIYMEDAPKELCNEGFKNDSSSSSTSQSLHEVIKKCEEEENRIRDEDEEENDVDGEEEDEENEIEKETENLQRENRKSLQPGSRNSSSQLLGDIASK